MTPEQQIIGLLAEYQRRNRLTDKAMATQLGIAPSSWSMFRRGRRNVSRPGILAGFARLYGRRMGLVRDFLTDGGDAT